MSANPESNASSLGPLAGAGLGARVGALFAAFEAIAASWLTRATLDGIDYTQQSAIAFGMSIAVHATLGACAGAAAAKFAGGLARRIERPAAEVVVRLATLGVVLALGAYEVSLLPNQAIEVRQSLALSFGLATAIVVSLSHRGAAKWLAGLVTPWTGALMLGVIPWLANNALADSGWTAKQVGALLAALACAGVATWFAARLSSPRALSYPIVGALLILTFAGCLLPQAVVDGRGAPGVAARGPHVILISLDTVRADHLSVYGHARDTTPFLREFAGEATVFEHAYSSGDFTLSSHASMFTGLYPRAHGARPDPDQVVTAPLPREALTLTEMLVERGWSTCGIASNCVLLVPQFGIAQGFEHYDSRFRVIGFPRVRPWAFRCLLQDLLHEYSPPNEFDLIFRGAAEINREVFAQLDRRDKDRPLFLFVNYMDAHAPYRPPAPFDTMYAPLAQPMDSHRHRDQRAELYRGTSQLLPADRDEYEAQYDGGIAYLDSQLRVLFERLKQDGIYDDALIIVTSDHGEAFGEHGTLEHGMSAYQEQVRVPLLIKRPRLRDARRVDQVAGGVDLVPTVLAELGIDAPEGLAGRALFGADTAPERVVFSEHYPSGWHTLHNAKRAIHQTAAMWNQFVQIRWDDGRTERFDLALDPLQERPLDSLPPGAPDLGAQLETWVAERRIRKRSDGKHNVDALNMLGYGK